jgi:hypothetical protein
MKDTLNKISFQSQSMVDVIRKQREQMKVEEAERKAEREAFKAEIRALLHG